MAFFTVCLCVVTFVEAGFARTECADAGVSAIGFAATGFNGTAIATPDRSTFAVTMPGVPVTGRNSFEEVHKIVTTMAVNDGWQKQWVHQTDLQLAQEASKAQMEDLGDYALDENECLVGGCKLRHAYNNLQALKHTDLSSALAPATVLPEEGHLRVQLNFIKEGIEKDARLYVIDHHDQPRINPDVLVSVLTDVAEVEEHNRRNYALDENGFQIVDFLNDKTPKGMLLSPGLHDLLVEMRDDSVAEVVYRSEWSQRIRQETELFVEAWRGGQKNTFKQHGLIHAFVTLDAVFRNTGVGDFGAVRLVHSDFERGTTLSGFITAFGDMWFKHLWNNHEFRKAAERTFSHRSRPEEAAVRAEVVADYAKPVAEQRFWRYWKVVEALNVWMCLTKGGNRADHFAMMDSSTVTGAVRAGTAGWTSGPQFKRYVATRRNPPTRPGNKPDIARSDEFYAMAVHPEEQNRWAFRKNMPYGQAYVFDSMATPHTAFQTDNEILERMVAADAGEPYTGPTRQSVESRTLQLVFDTHAAILLVD